MNGQGFAVGMSADQYYDFTWRIWGKVQMKPATK